MKNLKLKISRKEDENINKKDHKEKDKDKDKKKENEKGKDKEKGKGKTTYNIYNYQHNKWLQYELFSEHPAMLTYLPETLEMSEENFQYFIDKYGECVAKQQIGQQGIGFYSISKPNRHIESYRVKFLNQTRLFYSAKDVCKFFASKKTPYIVQQKINLVRVNNGITDIRVILQELDNNKWVVTGKCVKIAPPKFVVTYTGQPGREVKTINCLNRAHGKTIYSTEELDDLLNLLAYTAIDILKPHLETHILGLDVGIDTDGRLWLIEAANTHPQLKMFTQLKNKEMYRNILKHKSKYLNKNR